MRFATTALLMILAVSSALAAGPKALPCLSVPDAKDCLASVAKATLASEKSPESRAEGYSSLVSSLAKAGVRRDDIFSAATDDGTAPVYPRWSLAVARRTYALHFGIGDAFVNSPQRIEALADLLRVRGDGLERLMIAWAACEAREGEAPAVLAKWEGLLDRLCRLDDSDTDALEKEFPGLSALAAPVIDAYNRDNDALGRSIAVSLGVLTEYEKALDRNIPAAEREAILGVLAIGHLFNATALATSGHGGEAAKAIGKSLRYIAKVPTIRKTPEFQMALTQASWIYAKAGMRDESLRAVRESLARGDSGKIGSGGDRATALATVIETLWVLESTPGN